jgi:hypothetical protein
MPGEPVQLYYGSETAPKSAQFIGDFKDASKK